MNPTPPAPATARQVNYLIGLFAQAHRARYVTIPESDWRTFIEPALRQFNRFLGGQQELSQQEAGSMIGLLKRMTVKPKTSEVVK